MAHKEQRAFFEGLKDTHPKAFTDARVLDCGSLDVNGSLKDLFGGCFYHGVDQQAGRNVDMVHRVADLHWIPGAFFDTIVSAEMLEHDEDWRRSLIEMYRMLKPGGLLGLSMATSGRAEHGTARTPEADHATGVWSRDGMYYRNLTEEDLRTVFDFDHDFQEWGLQVQPFHCDLYFYGVKT